MAGTLGAGLGEPQAVVNNVPNGYYVNGVCLTDPNGSILTLNGAGQLPITTAPNPPSAAVVLATGTQNSSNTGTSFSTTNVSMIAVDITLTSFTGGVAPTITFFVQRLGASGVYYTIWSNTTAIATASVISASIGPGLSGGTASSGNGGFAAVLSGTCQFGWSTTGSPTSWTGSAQVTTR